MKILLIQPPSSTILTDNVFMHEPLALEYLAAGVKEDGHEARILDARLDPDVDGALTGFSPDLVGLTGYTSHLNVVRRLADRVRERLPRATVVVGGHHATVRPQDFNRPSIDAVVVGEGVFTLREIVRAIEGGRDFSAIPGLALPGAPQILTEPRPYTPLDDLPFPDRSLTAAYRSRYFNEWLRPLASIRTSLGCTARCSFCALWSITKGKYLRRRPESVVEELSGIAETNVFFCDDESMCDIQRMDRLADLIREAGIRKRYFLYSRGDTIVRHPELFRKWRDIGLAQVFIGMETFSDARLEGLNKGLSLRHQEQAARTLEDMGVLAYASFIVDPDFSREDFDGMKAYIRRLKLRYASFAVLTPLPGTDLYAAREQDLTSRKPELYDFLHAVLPTRLPLEEFYARFAGLFENSIPFPRSLSTLSRYGLRRIPSILRFFPRAIAAMKNAAADHATEEPPQ